MNILMVCMGNICRSPMAEGIAKNIVKKHQDKYKNINIDSAGTHAYHIGHAPDARAIQTAKKHGIDISHLKARAITPADFDKFDIIMVADTQNYQRVKDMASTPVQQQKIIKMLIKHPTKANEDLPDPYYADDSAFEQTYELLHDALNEWFNAL